MFTSWHKLLIEPETPFIKEAHVYLADLQKNIPHNYGKLDQFFIS